MLSSSQLGFSYNTDTQFLFPEFSCQPAETLIITGSSGKGKTTLMHLLAGILQPTSGAIKVKNVDICLLKGKKL